MSNMKLYNYIIKNAATKTRKGYISFLIQAVKESNMTKRIQLLCLPLRKHVTWFTLCY